MLVLVVTQSLLVRATACRRSSNAKAAACRRAPPPHTQMPRCCGLTATRRIRELERSLRPQRSAPCCIVGISAHAAEQDCAEGIAAGMDAFVVKPIRPAVLRTVLVRYFSTRALEGALKEGAAELALAALVAAGGVVAAAGLELGQGLGSAGLGAPAAGGEGRGGAGEGGVAGAPAGLAGVGGCPSMAGVSPKPLPAPPPGW